VCIYAIQATLSRRPHRGKRCSHAVDISILFAYYRTPVAVWAVDVSHGVEKDFTAVDGH